MLRDKRGRERSIPPVGWSRQDLDFFRCRENHAAAEQSDAGRRRMQGKGRNKAWADGSECLAKPASRDTRGPQADRRQRRQIQNRAAASLLMGSSVLMGFRPHWLAIVSPGLASLG